MNADFIRQVNPVMRIAIVGPECTGKTTLSQQLAEYFKTEWVREYARGYLNKLAVSYQENDLLMIAQGQMRIEDEFAGSANQFLFCDTNLVVMKIWSVVKYKKCHHWIEEEMTRRKYHLHLLTYVDIPWEEDPLREHPHERDMLFKLYEDELKRVKVPYAIIKGTPEERLKQAINLVEEVKNKQ
ncbi:MAG: AAA family ATPase [Chryseotalea sp.]|jgi:NadR type nicotinamide-nucleotide adenylyltransferase